MDLGDYLEAEAQRRAKDAQPQFAYAVWIDGKGWLKQIGTDRVFADPRIEVAQSAAQLYGNGAQVMPIDLPDHEGKAALQLLEKQLLNVQYERHERRWFVQLAHWLRNYWQRWILLKA